MSYIKTTKFPFAHKYGKNGWYDFLVKKRGWKKTAAKKATIRQAYAVYFKPPKKKKSNNKQLDLF